MRIASSQFEATMNRGLEFNQENISKLTEQLADGNKIQVPSDDPITAVRLSRLTREDDTLNQYRANIGAVKIRLSNNETYLTGVVNDVTQAHDQLVWASDGGNSSSDLNSMVQTLQSLRDSIYYSSNTKDAEGHYLFSGNQTGTPSLSFNAGAAAGSRYSYSGDQGEQKVVVGNGITQTANVNVQGLDTYLNQLDAAIDQLQTPGINGTDPALRAVLKTALDGSDAALSLVSGKIADLGGAQNILSTLDTNHANVSLSNETAMTDIGQLDYGVASTQLNGYSTALQASYKAYAKISSLSLFNIL
ncbi:flagellar hook-associated protein FlgL [Rugamonas sp.]|uniref:flagellar hook-associated protein FlgL n=1 Tax=Rugamonas sp. TaxID=1926287 RepID=UPI0025F44F9C|nr:flagellar hook-associated protein FlgL [Rugamonas sp.]